MRFDRLRVERAPGIEQPFELSELAPGFNVVLGPNGSGKSLVCRVVRELLWSTGKPNGISASLRIETERGSQSVHRDEDAHEWEARPPALPAAHHAGCFLLHAGDLLSTGAGTDLEIAREIKNQMAGGYDLDAVRAERFQVAARHGAAERRKLDAAEKELARVHEEFRALSQDEERLVELDRSIESAEAAKQRVQVLENLQLLAQEREKLANLTAEIEALPTGMERLSGAEGDNLEDRDEALAARLEELEVADAELSLKRARLQELIPSGTLPTRAEVSAWTDRTRKLEQLEERCLELTQAAAAADAAAKVARGHLAEDLEAQGLAVPQRGVLDELEQHLRREQNQREALAETSSRLQAIPQERTTAETRDLEEGVDTLRDWCSHEFPSGALTLRPWLWASGAVLSIGALFLSRQVEPVLLAVGAAAGAGLALLAWAFTVESTCRATRSRREQSASSFPKRALELPVEWEPNPVRDRLAELESELAEAQIEDERERERQFLVQRLAELDQTQDELDAAREEFAQRTGIASSTSLLTLVELAHRLVSLRESSSLSSQADAELDEALAARKSSADALVSWLAPHGYSCDDAASAIHALRALDERVQTAAHLDEEIAALEARRPQLAKAIEIARERVARTFTDAGLEEEDRVGLEQRLNSLSRYSDLVSATKVSEAQIARWQESLPGTEGEQGEAEIGEALRAVEAEAQSLNELVTERGAAKERLRAARAGTRMEDALDGVASAREELEEKHEQALDASVGSFLLRSIGEEHRQNASPEVLKRAMQLFGKFTQHKYELLLDDSGEQTRFHARDVLRGRKQELSQLSDGTRMQLLLAARFAYALELEEVPFFLDEALSFSDPERFAEIARVLFALVVEGRQIIYLTSKHSEVEAFERAAQEAGLAAPRVLDLAEARGITSAARAPSDLSYELIPQPPHPGSDSAEEYAVRLGVPLPGSESVVDGLHLFYLLRGDLDLLRTLVGAGCATVGQWRACVQSGAAPTLCEEPDQVERLNLLSDVAGAIFEAWRVGRGKSLGRGELIESGAVSERYQSGFAEIASECSGDTAEFLAVLESRQDERTKGFQKKKLEELSAWLEENEFLDPRASLDLDAARRRVLAESGPAVHTKRLSIEEIGTLTASIWSALEKSTTKRRAAELQAEQPLTADGA